MKKSIFFPLIIIGITFIIPTAIKADIAPPNSRQLDRCVRIENPNNFPDIFLIGQSTHPSGEITNTLIHPNKCLKKGYKFNRFEILGVPKTEQNELSLSEISKNTPGIIVFSDIVDPWGGYIDKDEHITKETISYTLTQDNTGVFSLQKTAEAPQQTETRPPQNRFLSFFMKIFELF